MIGKTNSGIILGIINVTCPNVSTVTLTQTGHAYSFTQTGTSMSFKLPNVGTWHITASYGGITLERDVVLAPGQVLPVTIMDDFYVYNRGVYAAGFASGWSYGEQSEYVYIIANAAINSASTSTGLVDLTGYNTVKAEVTGNISCTQYTSGQVMFELLNSAGTQLQEKHVLYSPPEWGGNFIFDRTWEFDVSSINEQVKFRMQAQTWAGGSDSRSINYYLHSIELLA